MKFDPMNKDELFDEMSNPNNIFIAQTRLSASDFIPFLWGLKVVLAIAVVISLWRMGDYSYNPF